MISLVAFDLDGTLCDCTELHYLSLNRALKELLNYEIGRDDHMAVFNGRTTNKKLEILRQRNIINQQDFQQVWQLKQQHTKNMIADILKIDNSKIKLHSYLNSQNIKIACITNSIRETAELMLQTTGQLEYLDLLIANDDIKHPKPHPEGYIRAMVAFGTMPETVLIVEDAPVGLEAARATGANIWAVRGPEDVILQNIIPLLEQYA